MPESARGGCDADGDEPPHPTDDGGTMAAWPAHLFFSCLYSCGPCRDETFHVSDACAACL